MNLFVWCNYFHRSNNLLQQQLGSHILHLNSQKRQLSLYQLNSTTPPTDHPQARSFSFQAPGSRWGL